MILIFDLDDTLYDERQFVDGGLKAVARYGETRWGLDAHQSLATLRDLLAREGRGKVFDLWLQAHGLWTKGRVGDCVRIYRHHRPDLSLLPEARRVIDKYRPLGPLYLVTDGHKLVQQNKVEALNLWPDFKRVFITHRFGVTNAKPSLHCFGLIKADAGCDWQDMVYVGDNPAKDFVSLNPLGAMTVRVLTGVHASAVARPGYEAQAVIKTLDGLADVLDSRFGAA